MTQDQFYRWMDDPSSMDAASVGQLREVVKRYPYFQTAQMMLAKNLRSENHIDQLIQLQLAAVMVPDRKRLYDYLHDREPVAQPMVQTPSEEAKEEVVASPVVEEEVPVPEETVLADHEEKLEVERDSLYDLIPEPIVYQLETADLPELPPTKTKKEEPESEPDALSFSEWLEYSEKGTLGNEASESQPKKKEAPKPARSDFELIDHFLSQQSDRPKKRAEFFNPQKAGAKSLEADFTVISETLANIYFKQEKYDLARQAYESLSLKYPEKSVYFAARLKEIDEKLNSE